MSENLERWKRIVKVGMLTGQTQIDRIRLRCWASHKSTIIFLGDSRAKAWPAPDINHTHIFLNRGIGFDTTRQVLQRLPAHVMPLQPQVVVVQAGINDCKELLLVPQNHAIIVQETLATLLQLAEQIGAAGAHPVLSTIFPVRSSTLGNSNAFWGIRAPHAAVQVHRAVAEVNRGLVTQYAPGVTVFDAASILQNSEGWLDPAYGRDELHLNVRGYQKLNQAFGPLLQEIVA